jgi:phosphoglycolate phosphatase
LSALLLFDIDGTLLLSGRAGVRAMTLAFEDVFGVADAFATVGVAGQTDRFLVSRALRAAGLEDTPDAHARFREAYLERLPAEILKRGTGRKELMPGVRDLLTRVSDRNVWHLALLTGNYEPAAHIKLTHFGLGGVFSWGAFGEDSTDRCDLARLALARAVERRVPLEARGNVVVVGDTPHDIDCAKAIGARVIAVATGGYTVDQLIESGADTVFEDLADTQAVLSQLL